MPSRLTESTEYPSTAAFSVEATVKGPQPLMVHEPSAIGARLRVLSSLNPQPLEPWIRHVPQQEKLKTGAQNANSAASTFDDNHQNFRYREE